jgi:hypothetical protein
VVHGPAGAASAPAHCSPSAMRHCSTHSTHHRAAIPTPRRDRTTSSQSDTASIPMDTAIPTSSPRPDKTPMNHSKTDPRLHS